jgi:GrpB-like predicted nucleotidyltransferase (UPF0157 family)
MAWVHDGKIWVIRQLHQNTEVYFMNTIVVPHDRAWKQKYEIEAQVISHALGSNVIAIHHIGSTAIPNILAKPIIDIMVEVHNLDAVDHSEPEMRRLDYEPMGEFGISGRRYFRKITPEGTRTHHVHIFNQGSPHAKRHLAFRDYLIAHLEKAREYSELKANLTKGGATSREAYMDGKQDFVAAMEAEALGWAKIN